MLKVIGIITLLKVVKQVKEISLKYVPVEAIKRRTTKQNQFKLRTFLLSIKLVQNEVDKKIMPWGGWYLQFHKWLCLPTWKVFGIKL